MNYVYDPNAGRYRGSDPEAARAFRELQRVVQQLRSDPIYKITSLMPQVGSYMAIPLWGKPTADGIAAHPLHFGMQTDGTNAAKLLINLMESPTNAAHAIPLGAMLDGSRRLHTNGQDCIWVSMPPNAFSGTSGGGVYIDPGPDGGGVGGGGGGGGDGGGGGGGGDGPGGGGGGGGPLGGGDDGSCPLVKTVVISGTGDPNYDHSWTCTWGGSSWDSPVIAGVDVHVELGASVVYGGTKWLVNTIGIAWSSTDGTSPCPPNGGYTWSEDSFGGSTSGAGATVS